MKKSHILLLLSFVLLLGSCAMKPVTNIIKQEPPLSNNDEVVIFRLQDSAPQKAVKLGTVKLFDKGFTTKCSEGRVNQLAKETARKMGGNLVKITKEKKPSMLGSSCYQIIADIYKVDNLNQVADAMAPKKIENPELNKLSDNFAIIHFFRNNSLGLMIGYNLMIGDDKTPVARSKYRFRKTVITNKFGKQKIWGKTEVTGSVMADIQPGKEYYIDTEIDMGILVGRPSLQLIDSDTGKKLYLEIPKDKDQTTDYLLLNDGRIIACEFDKRNGDKYLFSIIKKMESGTKKIKTSIDTDKVKQVILKSHLIPKSQ